MVGTVTAADENIPFTVKIPTLAVSEPKATIESLAVTIEVVAMP
jgi:hypothetical protein